MLTETELAFFRRRIEEVLREGRPTDWQRQFLTDMLAKIGRQGMRTKLSDKQFAILKRLTNEPNDRPSLQIVGGYTHHENHPMPRPRAFSQATPFGAGRLRGPRLRLRNPLRPPRLIRRASPLGPLSALGGKAIVALVALMVIVGVIGGIIGGAPDRTDRSSTLSSAVDGGSPVKAESAGKATFTITDGDTIKLNDGTRVRLVGFNTPEKFEPQCSAEAALGNRASSRLKELVAGARTTEVALVRCACKPGTEGTKKCNYGRSCGTLSVDGRDVGQTLIAEGLAVSFICGVTGCPPTPRPWCG